MGEPYLWRTANMSPRTCVIVKQMQSNSTDTHSCLEYASSHPRHTTQNGPYGQFLRLRRNCFFDDYYNRHADNMAQHYLKRGYPQDLITQSRDKAFVVLHLDLIHKSVKKTASESCTPLVITYDKTNPDLMGLVYKYWPILQSTTRGAILFKNPPVRAYRWSENLQDILVHATLKPLNTQQTKHIQQSCTHQDCQTCKLLSYQQKTEIWN